jgi:hypothetical protein
MIRGFPSSRPSLFLLAFAMAAVGCGGAGEGGGEAGSAAVVVPTFSYDLSWPVDLPEEWLLGPGTGIYVDSRDHVWLLQRPERVTPEDFVAAREGRAPGCCASTAPPLIEVDPQGNIVQSWGGLGEQAEWPIMPHGIFVDHNDFVWVGTSIHHQVMKFTRDGEHLLTIGEFDQVGGSNHRTLLGGAADFFVDPERNELYIADGYGNRRVVVYDAATGEYRRHWGAYGNEPVDEVEVVRGPREPGTPPPSFFNLVHGIDGSRDGLVYVADRTNSRIQVFTREGEFVAEKVLREGGGAAFDVAFSNDADQTFMYVADGSEHRIWILRRGDLEIVGEFGSEGTGPGQMGRPHNISSDSRGNVYVAEADPGRRFQKFTLQSGVVEGN